MRLNSNSGLDSVVLDGLRRGTPTSPSGDEFANSFAEGGKARALVELCSRLQLPAIFLDRQGLAFFATREVSDYLGSDLSVEAGQITVEDEYGTELIAEAVSRAVCAMDKSPSRRALKVSGRRPLYLTIFDYPNPSDYQILKVVVLLARTAGEHRDEIALVARQLAGS